ncbi:MAG: hypothetical protein AB8E15_02835 [Bdellovibrionales bacterium]
MNLFKSLTQRQEIDDHLNKVRQQSKHRFHDISLIFDEMLESKEIVEKYSLRNSPLAIIGIGGSSLGARVMTQLEGLHSSNIIFFDSLDPSALSKGMERLETDKSTNFLLVSKSGATLESLCIANELISKLNLSKKDISERFLALTSAEKSPLKSFCSQYDVACYKIPDSIGGRYSIFSKVGLIPYMAAGGTLISNSSLKKLEMRALESALKWTNLALTSFDNEKWISLFWTYSDSYLELCKWSQQLWAESLGKKLNLSGESAKRSSSPFFCSGTNDQHSILQQFIEGEDDKLFVFINESAETNYTEVKNHFTENSSLDGVSPRKLRDLMFTATSKSLIEAGKDCITIELENKMESIFEFCFSLELAVATIASYHNIDAFNQPGVEASKIITKQLLRSGR